MNRSDLDLLEELLADGREVRALKDCRAMGYAGIIGLRHDVDDSASLDTMLKMGRWEAERGYQSTWFILHTAPYWHRPGLRDTLDELAEMGHEIGIHTNAIAEGLEKGWDPDWVLDTALDRLRGWGHEIIGVAGHGDARCYWDKDAGKVQFVNHEHFDECPWIFDRPRKLTYGGREMTLVPRPLARFGLEYEALHVHPRVAYLSDSGGSWSANFDEVARHIPEGFVQILQHPDWWDGVYG